MPSDAKGRWYCDYPGCNPDIDWKTKTALSAHMRRHDPQKRQKTDAAAEMRWDIGPEEGEGGGRGRRHRAAAARPAVPAVQLEDMEEDMAHDDSDEEELIDFGERGGRMDAMARDLLAAPPLQAVREQMATLLDETAAPTGPRQQWAEAILVDPTWRALAQESYDAILPELQQCEQWYASSMDQRWNPETEDLLLVHPCR